jgi:23S rRNA (guanosine2251-2'-O)-methyltransferase
MDRSLAKDRELLCGPHAVLESLRAGRRTIYRLLVARQERGEGVRAVLAEAEARRIPTENCQPADLDRLVRGGIHQGIAVEAAPYPYADPDALLSKVGTGGRPALLLVLDGVLDPQNLGAIVRTAEGAGVDGIVLPRDRAAAVSPAAVRASAGAAEHLAIARVTNLARYLGELKARGVWIAGTEASAGRTLFETDLTGPLAVVIGGEGRGMRALTRRHCDFLVHIPAVGRVASLNASAASAICLFEVVRQRNRMPPVSSG